MRRCLPLMPVLVAAAFGLAGPAQAETWPAKPITLVVPFPPGGGTDVVARLLAARLAPRLGQAVVIENKPGGSTTIGAGAVAKAAPDGHTLLLSGSSTYSIVPALRPGLNYDPIASFAHVAVVAKAPLVMLTGSATEARTVADLVRRAKGAPDPLMYGTFGNGSGPHLAGAMLEEAAGIRMTSVPYRGSAPALTALIAGEIPVGFDTVAAAAPQVQAGKLRALAVTGDKRAELLPDVPTYAEAGLARASLVSWYGLVAPARTPDPVVQRLAQETAAVMADPEVRKAMSAAGLEPVMIDAKGFQQLVRKEVDEFKALAQRASITLD